MIYIIILGTEKGVYMKTVKVVSIVIMLLVLSAVCVFAKGGAEDTSKGGPAEITFWTFNNTHQEFFEDAAARWNQQNPDRQIQLLGETFPYEDMHNNLLIALQSGVGAPDMVDIELGKFPNFLQGDIQLVPMNDYVDKVKDDFITARFEIYSKDGKYYGMPFHVGAGVIYYNVEILNAAGVNPDSIKTWDDFVQAGLKVKEKTGKLMTSLETTEHWSFWPLISQQGSDFFYPDGRVALDNDINIKTLQFLYDLIYKYGIAAPAAGGYHHSEEYYGAMNAGTYASIWMPMWYMNRFTDYMPDLKGKIAIRPAPAWTPGGTRSSGLGGTGTVVTNQAKNIELTKEFLAFAKLSEEGNIRIWEFLGFDPPRWSVWDDPAMNQPNKFTQYFTNKDIFGLLLEVKDEINPITVTAKLPECIGLVQRDVMFQVLGDRSKTPAQALRDAANKLR